MREDKNPQEFYENLKIQLEESTDWPSEYLYKFIIPASNQGVAEIENIFDGLNAKISLKNSSKGKYTSVSILVKMDSPDHVIEKYQEIGKRVEGVISL